MTKLRISCRALTAAVAVSCSTAMTATSCSTEKEDVPPASEKIVFSEESGVYNGVALPCRKAVIGSETEKPVLVLYLHGGSAKGTDNRAQIEEKGLLSICDYLSGKRLHSVVVVPQCPPEASWGGRMTAVLEALTANCATRYGADAERLYLFGGSMGGTGSWELVSACRDRFAAAMPVAGNPSRCDPAAVASTPVLTVMGTADALMNARTAADFCTRVTAVGGTIRFDLETGWDHGATCTDSYTAERPDWVFARRRP